MKTPEFIAYMWLPIIGMVVLSSGFGNAAFITGAVLVVVLTVALFQARFRPETRTGHKTAKEDGK